MAPQALRKQFVRVKIVSSLSVWESSFCGLLIIRPCQHVIDHMLCEIEEESSPPVLMPTG